MVLPLWAQQVQTIRGTVIDNQSKEALIGASVVIVGTDPLIGSSTDTDGKFRIENVPVGRQNIKVSYLGYEEKYLNNLIINSAKELVLTIELQESIITAEEATIKAKQDKLATNNELVSVSGRSFSIDETQRYAGSLGDPSRMASNFAGVAGGGNDQRNDIIIRGNSPLGLLWRLEGADIPNPNHFSNQGANGGPVSILNNNLLANSDFLTGAWPAEYGAATSGVFDLKMRNGNNEKREHTFQIGFNGVELMTEGPIKKGGASYLLSYRYSTLAFFDKLGLKFGASGIPAYQDLSLKINLPTKKIGTFSLWAIGGTSSTTISDESLDSSERSEIVRPQIVEFSSGMFASGITHSIAAGKNAYIKTVISVSGERNRTTVDTLLYKEGNQKSLYFSSASTLLKNNLHSFYVKKFDARNSLKSGIILTRWHMEMSDSVSDFRVNSASGFRIDYGFNAAVYTAQAYTNWTHRFGSRLTMNAGLHLNSYLENSSYLLEPRIGFQYALNSRSRLSFGYGLHGQAQALPIYYQETLLSNGQTILTNKNLGFTKSNQFVIGYDVQLSPNLHLKSETYFQYLTDIPVTQYPSVYSVVNFGSDFSGLPNIDSLENKGLGRNYGLEITLERSFNRGLYFLFTTSLFQSEYLASDSKWRNTAYNSNFVFNVLGGKEWKIKQNNILSINLKVTYAGGRREIPIDLAQSQIEQRFVGDPSRAYENRLPDYFRMDFRIGYKINAKKVTHEWAFDLRNVLNTQNLLTRQYNPATGELKDIYQIGIFPVPLYRLQF